MREAILNSTRWVVEKSRHVKLNENSVLHLVERYLDWLDVKHPEQDELVPPLRGKELAEWVFVVEILNHCFWPDPGEPRWEVEYKGKRYSGYWALEASLIKAEVELGYSVHRASFLATIRTKDLERIFSGSGMIPLFEERWKNLREAGQILTEYWGGSVVNILEEARGSALRLVHLLKENFPSFRDEAIYLGRKVYFYKRAQIFPYDLNRRFWGKKWGKWYDLDKLTAFADYKLPQVMRHLGIIEYTPQLAAKIDNMEYLRPGSEEEIEIRAATIQACELIKKKLKTEKGIELSSPSIDYWLWSLGQEESFRTRPYHRTRTIFY